MEIFKRKDFARWQAAHRLSDEVLCKAVDEMCRGLVDASLGGELFKKRVAAHGAGKRGGYRTLRPHWQSMCFPAWLCQK
ncbi:type II toxin-antitoxin system RelE/ParE family toxin [Pseudomonas pudica]|uniref:type II toxin-antitoxin system RelE/ParE family toxin n=1 Tax=Pseudomonas pudica TaxID=272772 RepID=UPI003D16F292